MLSSVSNFMVGVFGSRNQRLIKRYGSLVAAANALEAGLTALERRRVARQDRRAQGAVHAPPQDLDALLPEAFALVREAARRTLGMRHFDVQLIGGIALHQGKIAEMRTGEGKTLVATLNAYLNALSGKGVHVVTVNEYLAQRDADWMGPVYRFLGLTVGVIKSNQATDEKRAGLRGRHHLRHQQRVRLRLSARQPRVPARGSRPANLELRDRRRGRLDPHRRGAHAADHLGALRGEHRALRPDQSADSVAEDPQAAAGQGERRHRVHAGRAARRHGQLARRRCRRARRSRKRRTAGTT